MLLSTLVLGLIAVSQAQGTPGVERAPDVSPPPPLPILARPVGERVSLDDPTVELGHAAIVGPPLKLTRVPAGFLKVTIPDPFELRQQVKPKLPPTVEPGLTLVPVNPQRIK
jgi:hypothetical protein